METSKIRLKYLKDVLGIKQVLISDQLRALHKERAELEATMVVASSTTEVQSYNLIFQVNSKDADVLFLSHQRSLSIEEMQLLEKIILALKIPFNKVDIAHVQESLYSKEGVSKTLQNSCYKYVFLQGEELSRALSNSNWFGSVYEFNTVKVFTTFHPQDMIRNPDLKKEAWTFFKTIIPTLRWSS